DKNPEWKKSIDLDAWIYGSGLPVQPSIDAVEFTRTDKVIQDFNNGVACAKLDTAKFTTHHWIYLLRNINQKLESKQLDDLEKTFHFNSTGNSEVAFQWFVLCIRNDYQPAYTYLEDFLTKVGRRKFVKPLFAEMLLRKNGAERARVIYEKTRPG